MHHFIDRRQNPKGKSLGNRQRFLRRARSYIKEMVDKSIRDRPVRDSTSKDGVAGEKVTISAKGIAEPRLVHSASGGERQIIFPGNREFVVGDSFPRPKSGRGKGGKKASDDGEGEDGFTFTLTQDEYLDLLFEGLELPDLVKKSVMDTESVGLRHAGISKSGTPSSLNLIRTMRNSLGRRIALRRPSRDAYQKLETLITALEDMSEPTNSQLEELEQLRQQLREMDRKRQAVSFFDPVDLRYNFRVPDKVPKSKAVVFCLMDVSGSMQEREKDLAKRFFVLLHLFLERRYERTEIVFVRHTHLAQEVDEDTFFYDRETGGTIVSTALEEMHRIIQDRYRTDEWNIYAAQASDGENLGNDSEKCEALLNEHLLPICQYYAYVEILDDSDEHLLSDPELGGDLWQAFRRVKEDWQTFEMQRVSNPSHIYPVFRDLFTPKARASAS